MAPLADVYSPQTKEVPMSAFRRSPFGAAMAAGSIVVASATIALPPAAADAAVSYTVTVGSKGSWTHPDDTPANGYIDKDGTFYFQEAHALYGAADGRAWTFYSGGDFD